MKRLFTTLSFAFIIFSYISGQTNNSKICDEGDCPTSVFNVQLNESLLPSSPANYSNERTERFKQAFQSFQSIKQTYASNNDWEEKRNESQLGGKNCLRHYQLEAQFGYEYIHNPDFQKFVDSTHPNAGNFVRNSFDSSRKGINLSKRMSTNCPEEVEEMKKKEGPTLTDLPNTYQKLGQELGYFDEDGKLMKPLDGSPSANQDIAKLSSKNQVKALQEQLSQMPFEQVLKDKLNGLKSALGATKPKVDMFTGALGSLNANLGSFMPSASDLLGKANMATDQLSTLKGMIPNISKPDLFSKIGSLFNLGLGLGGKASDLVDNSKNLKNKLDDLTNKSDKLKEDFEKKQSAIDKLLNELAEVSKKKEELKAKLEDKPKDILEELRKEVPDVAKKANDILDQTVQEVKDKNKLQEQLEKLNEEKAEIEDQLKSLEEKKKDIAKEYDDLEKEKIDAEAEVEEIKKLEEKIETLKKKISDLKPEDVLKDQLSDCAKGLKDKLLSITGLDEKKEKLKNKLEGLFSLPGKMTSKLTDLKRLQTNLKLPKNGIPIVGNIQEKIDGLIGKTTELGARVEKLTDKQIALQEKVNELGQRLNLATELYDKKATDLDNLDDGLIVFVTEKSDLKEKLNQTLEKVDVLESTVSGFIDRYNIFSTKIDCNGHIDLKEALEKVENQLDQTEPEIDELEKELDKANAEESQLTEQTQEVENEVKEQIEKVEELKREEQFIKQEYGSDLKLDPVTMEEWSESNTIERTYWEAVFHPDDEVVEGQKGRYFEVKLKDASKKVKLLFGPGEYCMSKSDFRKKYGSTIGSFVTEALHAMKKSNQEKVKIFIQGSADNVGHETFSGKLDQQFYYETVNVLPQKSNPDKFSNTPKSKAIPKVNFRNIHLPDLRAQYLKEMIQVYSKKFDPVVLEGVVKDIKDEGERNAIIYLYIPEEVLAK